MVKEGFFFFEKKKQKTFAHVRQHPCFGIGRIGGRNLQKFFASFFQKRRILPFAFLLIAAAPVTGDWLTEKSDGVITITPCGDEICGEISGVSGFRPDGSAPRNSAGASECHLRIIRGMRPDKDGRMAGTITDPRDGDVYQAKLWIGDDGTLRLRGYIAFPLLGQTQTWHRFAGTRTADCHFVIPSG